LWLLLLLLLLPDGCCSSVFWPGLWLQGKHAQSGSGRGWGDENDGT
jgi:hypothetical protein